MKSESHDDLKTFILSHYKESDMIDYQASQRQVIREQKMEAGGLSQNDLMNEYKQETNRVWKFVAKRMVLSNEFT